MIPKTKKAVLGTFFFLITMGGIFFTQEAFAGLFFSTEEDGTMADSFLIDLDESATDFVDLLFHDSNSQLRWDISNSKFIFNQNLDLEQNQLLNTRLQNVSSPPACAAGTKGLLYFDTDDNKSYLCNGSIYQQIDGGVGGGTLDSSYDYGGAGVGKTINVTDGAVELNGTGTVLSLGNGTANNIALSFNDGTPRTLTWDDTNNRFAFNSTVRIESNAAIVGVGYIAGDHSATDSDGTISLGRDASAWETITFDSTTDNRFEFSDDLFVEGDMDIASGKNYKINGVALAAGDITGVAASGANSDITSLSGLTGNIGSPTVLTMASGGAMQTGTTDGNTALLRAYDVDGTSYTTFATLTAGNTPTFDLASGTTLGGVAIQTGTDATNDTVSSTELDAVCGTDNKILKRSGGIWACADESAGGGTLDSSYDYGGAGVGKTINVTDGAVALSGTGTVLSLGDGTASNIALSFNDGTPRTLTWDDTNNRFAFNSTVRMESNASIVGIGYIAGDHSATDSDGTISLGRDASAWETFTFDSTTDNRFELSDDLDVAGTLSATGIDLGGNQISNVRIQNNTVLADCAAGTKGKIYFNTSDNKAYVCNGTTYLQIDAAGGDVSLDMAYDYTGSGAGSTITVDSGALVLSGTGTVLQLGNGTSSDSTLSFNDGVARTLTWDDSEAEFLFNNPIEVTGNATITGTNYVAVTPLNTDSDGVLSLGRNASVWETLSFDATTDDRFELSDDLAVSGTLSASTLSIDTTPPTYSGGARPTRKVTLSSEFPGATMTGDGSNNSGTMISDFCSNTVGGIPNTNTGVCNFSGNIHNYYSWDQSGGSVEDYDIWIRWRVPANFSAWTSNPILVAGKRTDVTNNEVRVYVYDTSGVLENSGGTQIAGTSWTEAPIEAIFSGTYSPGAYMTIRVHMVSDAGGDTVQVGEISLDYLINN